MNNFSIRRHALRPMSAQKGFTLIELITVIVIIGVLAAVALPRFADLQTKARVNTVTAVGASMKTAMALVKAAAMAKGDDCSATGRTVVMDATTINVDYCYPKASDIASAANVDATPWNVTASPTTSVVFGLKEANDGGAIATTNCKITYTAATGAPSTAGGAASIAVVTTGC